MEKRQIILLLAVFCFMFLPITAQDKSQITMTFENESLPSVLRRLEKASSYKIIFTYNNVENYHVNGSIKNATLESALRYVLDGNPLEYTIKDKLVYITKIQASQLRGQEMLLRGHVISADNKEPVIGASVRLLSKNNVERNMIVTDINGAFTLHYNNGDKIQISYIGMKPKTISITNNEMTITLDIDDKTLGEVVVNGIYTRKAESYTGAAATITSKDLKRVGNGNILQSLKSLDPSVYIADNLSTGSDPNSIPTVSMRGTSSFPAEASSLKSNYQHDPNSPLWILDGFETSPEHVVDLDMNRIESVTILKDASAKALYGSKAANGVIVIETRRLAGTETRVTYNGSLSLEFADLSSYDMCNAIEKLQIEQYEGLYTDSYGDAYKQQQLDNLYNKRKLLVMNGLNTDWMSKPLHNGIGQKHNVNVELGDARSLRTILDFTYNDVSGAMKESYRRNLMGSAAISYRKKNILFRNILEVISNHGQDSPYGTFSDYVKMNPYWQSVDKDGNILRYAEDEGVLNTYNIYSTSKVPNPLYDATIGTSLKSTYAQITNNFYTEWTINPDWKATLRLGAMQKRNDADSFYPANHSMFVAYLSSAADNLRRGRYIMENGKGTELGGDLNINYNHSFGKNNLFTNAGYFISERKYQAYQETVEGFANSTIADVTFARQYLENSTPTGYASTNREMSFLLAASYDYDNRYLADATIRESASSLYGADKRWANSWSLGLGWNLHHEPFMKNISWLKQMKIRCSYGLTGNQNFNTNAAIATYRYYTGYSYVGYMGAYLANMPNSGLMWEQKKDFNVGFDLKTGAVALTFDWYTADTKNMLTDVTIPTSTGFPSVKDNLGLVRNSGIELKASITPWQIKDGFVNVYGTFVYTKNKIVELSESMREYNNRMLKLAESTNQTAPVLMYQDGLSMNTIWAVQSAGIDPQTGQEIYIKRDGSLTYTYDSSNMIAAGDATPKYRGTAGFTAEYKGIGFTATLTYLAGGQMYNSTLIDRVEDADIQYNVDRRVLTGRWIEPGQITQYKGFSATNKTRATTRFVQNRNELNLSSISTYYEFPKIIYSRLAMQRLRFAVYLNNIATFSSIKVERGTSYPFARTLSFALTATF